MNLSTYAPELWAAGLEVVPLYPETDIPYSRSWQSLQIPTPQALRDLWTSYYAQYNLGLITGKAAGMMVLKCHIANRLLARLLKDLLPENPWYVVQGSNYQVLVFQVPPDATRTETGCWSIYDVQGKELVKCYGDGAFYPLPTNRTKGRKRWSQNRPLHEVADNLPRFPDQLEAILRGALTNNGAMLDAEGYRGHYAQSPTGVRLLALKGLANDLAIEIVHGQRPLREALQLLESEVGAKSYQDDISLIPLKHQLFDFMVDEMKRAGCKLPHGWDAGLEELPKLERLKIPFDKLKDEAWSYEQLTHWIHEELSRVLGNSTEELRIIDRALYELNHADLSPLEERVILRTLRQQPKMKTTDTQLRAHRKQLKTERERETHADCAKDLLEILERTHEYRYHENRMWRWEGSHWVEVPRQRLLSKVTELFGHLRIARRSSDYRGILEVAEGMREAPLEVDPTPGVNLLNGYLTENLELLPHDPNYGMTYTLPYGYDAKLCPPGDEFQHMPLFRQFLHDCWGGDEDYQDKVEALRQAIAASLFGLASSFQRAFLLHGVPKSGKTQLLHIIGNLFAPETRTSVPPEDWGDRFRPGMMYRKLFNGVGELSERKRVHGPKFKDVIDGTEQVLEVKSRNVMFAYSPVCGHWFASNHLPKTTDMSDGFNRRWLILQFKQPVPDDAMLIRDLGNVIVHAERQAIFAWAVKALPALQQQSDYTLPASHNELIEVMAYQNNSVRFFVQGSGLLGIQDPSLFRKRMPPEERKELFQTMTPIYGATLYSVYSGFCSRAVGVRPVTSSQFHQTLGELAPILGFAQARARFGNTGKIGFLYYNLMPQQTLHDWMDEEIRQSAI